MRKVKKSKAFMAVMLAITLFLPTGFASAENKKSKVENKVYVTKQLSNDVLIEKAFKGDLVNNHHTKVKFKDGDEW